MDVIEKLSTPLATNEAKGVLNKDWIPQLQKKDYFKLFIPKQLGGLELNLIDALPFLIETARFNGSLGWIHNLVAGANAFCTCFEEEVAYEIFGKNTVMCSGSGVPNGRVDFTAHYMNVNGVWNKCTGAHWATHFTAVGKTKNGNQVTFICPSRYVEIKEDWHGFGMKATSTNQIEISNAQLPKQYQFQIGYQKSFLDYTLAQIDFELFARICISTTWQGLVYRLLDLVELNKGKSNALESTKEKLIKLDQQRKNLIHSIENGKNTTNSKNFMRKQVQELSLQHSQINLCVEKLIWGLGLFAIDQRNLISWAYKDIKVANQHYFL